MTKYEVAQRLRDARLAAGLSRSELGIGKPATLRPISKR